MSDPFDLSAPDLVPSATSTLATFSSSLTYTYLPNDVIAKTKELIIDNLGVILYGNTLPWTRKIASLHTSGTSPILGTNTLTTPSHAALTNATAGHGFEFDEIHSDGGFHPGSIIVPSILALGNCSGRDFITATVAGYEVGLRVGMTVGGGLFYRGHHPQGCTGVFSSAAASSRILNLDATRTQNALGIAGSHASGLMAAQEGAMVKRMHAGTAARSGVEAALLAQQGFTGIHNVLEAPWGGYLSTYSGSPVPENLLAGLGTEWQVLKVGYKPFATVASIHTALDGLLYIMRENKLTADDIESIEVGCGKVTYRHCAWEYRVEGVTGAQMNLFFPLAMIAIDGDASINQFNESRLAEPRVLQLIKRMKAHIDPEYEAMGRAFRHGSTVEVKTKDGRTIVRKEIHRRGSPGNPARPGDIEKKFRTLAGTVLDEGRVQKLWDFVQDLENQPSLDELFKIIGGGKSVVEKVPVVDVKPVDGLDAVV
jgi:2-methylcitrate dehydratase PrpD